MNNEKMNWSSFQKRITIFRPIEKVYAAWAVPANVEHWFLEKATYTKKNGNIRNNSEPAEKGDTFSWKWNNWNFEEKGRILEANHTNLISFTFGTGGVVHVRLKDHKGATEVVLTQEGIPTDDTSKQEIYTGCACGWTFWLTNLKAWLEHGITLHEKGLDQEQVKNLVNS